MRKIKSVDAQPTLPYPPPPHTYPHSLRTSPPPGIGLNHTRHRLTRQSNLHYLKKKY